MTFDMTFGEGVMVRSHLAEAIVIEVILHSEPDAGHTDVGVRPRRDGMCSSTQHVTGNV